MLDKKIYVAGHMGMVGSSILRNLKALGYENLVYRTRSELDLIDQAQVESFFKEENPDEVYLAAALVGGIYANNTYPADFIHNNLMVQCNVINSAFRNGVEKLLFLGSSCIYPKNTPQPIKEEALLTGKLELTNEPYAIAKIAGIKLCESYNRQYGVDYRSVMPTNLYGPNDKYHNENSHVIPALISRFYEAKTANREDVLVWGSGNARREFLFVDDMASAAIDLMNLDKVIYQQATLPMVSHVNVGAGDDITIFDLALMIKETVGYKGRITFDATKPDGPAQKLLDTTLLNSWGWKPKVSLKDGLEITYNDYLSYLKLKIGKNLT